MATGRKEERRKLSVIIFLMALGNFVLHLAVSENYELHKESYLFLQYAQHPQWGYISAPPFAMWISTIAVKLMGGSAFVVRLFPAIASAAMVGFLGIIIKDLGGRKWAVFLGTLAFALSPAFLRLGEMYSATSFNVMFWFFYFYLFTQMLRTENYNYWYLIGFISGLGFMNSYTMAIPLAFTIIGLLMVGKFSAILTRQFWIGLIGIVVIISPNILWQYNHNWPIFYYLQELNATQFLTTAPAHFLSMQFIMNSPSAIIWISGLVGIIIFKPFRKYISIVLAFVMMLLFLVYFNAKPHYMLGIYPILFVFGAYGLELLTYKYKWIMPSITMFVSVIALLCLPLSLPLLKQNSMVAYSQKVKAMGLVSPFTWDDEQPRDLPLDYANRIGWKELAQQTENAFESLSAEEQENAIIFSENIDYASAVSYHKRKTKMPEVVSFSGSYKFWSPKTVSPKTIFIVIDQPTDDLFNMFENINVYYKLNVKQSTLHQLPIVIYKNPTPALIAAYAEKRHGLVEKFKRKLK